MESQHYIFKVVGKRVSCLLPRGTFYRFTPFLFIVFRFQGEMTHFGPRERS